MLIVRRIRRPLMPPDPEPAPVAAASPPVAHASVSVAAEPKTVSHPIQNCDGEVTAPPAPSAAKPAPNDPPVALTQGSTPADKSDHSQLQKRSDSGQFQSDSSSPAASQPLTSISQPPAGSSLDSRLPHPSPQPITSPRPSTLDAPLRSQDPQPSTPTSQPSAWSRRLDEPATDYQLFVSWLQLPESRQFRKAAAKLECSIHRLRRLASRHEWKSRAAAFDNHRANLTSSALDQLLNDEIADWKQRAERFRQQEWALHEEMIQAARAAARELREHPHRIKVSDLTRLFDLASILGRRACGMPLDPADSPPPEPPGIEPEWEAALRKIYGAASEARAKQSANQTSPPPPSPA